MIVDSAYPLSLWHHRGTCPAIPESNRRQKSTLRSRVPPNLRCIIIDILGCDFFLNHPSMKSNQEDSLVLVLKPNLHLQGSLYKWSPSKLLSDSNCGDGTWKNWWFFTPPISLTYPLQKAGWKTMFLPFSGDIRSFSGGVFLQKGPHLWALKITSCTRYCSSRVVVSNRQKVSFRNSTHWGVS